MRLLKSMKREFLYNLGKGYALVPEEVTIEVIYDCMFRCQMCHLWTKDFKTKRMGDQKVLSRPEIEEVIGELSSMGVKSIHFCGGEPFARKDFMYLVRYASALGLRCSTFSNGYRIGKELAREIVQSGLNSLGISIDSADGEIHDTLRGVKGAFLKATEGVRLVRKAQKEYGVEAPELFINCTVTSKNFSGMQEMVEMANELDVRSIRFFYLSVVDKDTVERTNRMMGEEVAGFHSFAFISPEYLLRKEQIDRLEDVIERTKERCGPAIKCDIDPALLRGDRGLLQKGEFPVSQCQIPWRSAVITPGGDVIPCSMFTEYKMGNIRETGFKEIWNNQSARKIRKSLKKGLPPICRKCCFTHEGDQPLWKRIYSKVHRRLKMVIVLVSIYTTEILQLDLTIW